MSDTNHRIDEICNEHLTYLYETAAHKYGSFPEIDDIVQDTIMAFLVKLGHGDKVKYPKAFLSSTLHHKYNDMLRRKYKNSIVTYDIDESIFADEAYNIESITEEYASVRREIGRLIQIYREVTVRYYVHGKSVEQIANELGISKGTVLSRLSSARGQIKEGLQTMEKYSEYSYAPKTVSLGIWGNSGLSGEPFSLLRSSQIESNILVLAYENPVSVRGLADTMGMPCAYIEPVVDSLVSGELLGKTAGGLVYTRCFMQKYEDSFGDIAVQESLADKYAERVWEIAWKHLEPLTHLKPFEIMNEKQKATMVLFFVHEALVTCVQDCKPLSENELKVPPERKNGGRWLATATVYENGQKCDNIYKSSGPVRVNYCARNDGKSTCQMFDFQSLFGDAHWAYSDFKYRVSLQTVLRFYASLLPCGVKPDNEMIYELVPELEKLHIVRRNKNGEIVLDIPSLPFDELEMWQSMLAAMTKELKVLLKDELAKIWVSRKNKVPKHIDYSEHFIYTGACGAYHIAQLVAIVQKGLLPYNVEIGKTPLIYIVYRKAKYIKNQ